MRDPDKCIECNSERRVLYVCTCCKESMCELCADQAIEVYQQIVCSMCTERHNLDTDC